MPKSTPTALCAFLVLTGSNYLSGEFEVVYQSTNNAWDIDPNLDGNQSIILVAYLADPYLGNIFDGVLFRVDLSLMAAAFKAVAQGTFTNLFPVTGYLPIALPQFNDTVKFTMLDQNGNAIDISDQGEVCGGLKIVMRTRVQPYS